MLPEVDVFMAFIIASIGLTLLPGPDNLLVLSISALHGAKAGLPIALGMAAGNFVHTLAVALGLSAFIAHTPIALVTIKTLGVMYLLWLAWQSWHQPLQFKQTGQSPFARQHTRLGLFKRGVLMNILNPKVAIFFVAFFPQFVNNNATHGALQILALGTAFVLQAAIIFGAIALSAAKLQTWVVMLNPRGVAIASSSLFVLLAGSLALYNIT